MPFLYHTDDPLELENYSEITNAQANNRKKIELIAPITVSKIFKK